MSAEPKRPVVGVFDHTGNLAEECKWLEQQSQRALPLCLGEQGSEDPVLPDLEEVEISLISDEEIARVHSEFMDDPTATDVITFHHGEILVSADTARREGPEHGHSLQEELLLYLIHGLLHLNGHTDLQESDRRQMHECQDRILLTLICKESP